jgi:hypothetical protein
MLGDLEQGYVHARRVLLDALEALAAHREAIILVGAQAIYLHTGEGELATQVFTTDGDLALNPDLLGPSPLLAPLLEDAGFLPSQASGAIGTWVSPDGIPVDLMVPAGAAPPGSGRRSAALGPHGNRAARTARGLEAALVDHQEMLLEALDPADRRQLQVRVAGPAALLVAKLHKLHDRRDHARRQDDKDALDIYRLLTEITSEEFARGLRALACLSQRSRDPTSAPAA